MGEMNRAQQSDFDLAQFHAVFFEEAGENLASLEGKLLAIDVAAAGDDELNAIFRFAHSIKGGAATFGFSDVTELTHELETLLDRVRRHELALTRAMVDVLLEAGDVLRAQLARYQDSSSDSPDTTDLVARIGRLAAGEPGAANGDAGARRLEVRLGPLADAAIADSLAELFRDIPSLGTFEPLDGGRLTDGYRRFKVVTTSPDSELIELFSFHVAREQIAIAALEPERQEESKAKARTDARDARADAPRHPGAAVEGDGFGFFVDPATLPQARPSSPSAGPASTIPEKKATAEKGGSLESTTLRVSVEKVDHLINLVGELVITQAMLAQHAGSLDPVRNQLLLAGVSELERSTRHLQEAVLSIRMIPMSFVFNRFPRLIRDLAAKLGKSLELKMVGEATELDKGLIEKIIDPLTHLVRNSADHGIEPPEQRVAAGKPATGTITLAAAHQGGSILIEVKDDGAGLKRDRILAKARECGLPVRDDMTDPEVWALIWEPGFSTADQLSDVSGRGVGMDVVRRNIASLGGTVELDSAEGYGTRIGAAAADAGDHGRHVDRRGRREVHPAARIGGRVVQDRRRHDPDRRRFGSGGQGARRVPAGAPAGAGVLRDRISRGRARHECNHRQRVARGRRHGFRAGRAGVPDLPPRRGGVRHRHSEGPGDPQLRDADPHRQCAGVHQGRGQPARRDRSDRRPAADVRAR